MHHSGGGRNALLARHSAFTLAEVLITLGIIGIVAVLTIPNLVADYRQRSMNTAANVFNRKLGEALKVMNSQSLLAGYNSTEEFVNELSRHIKIVKTCDNTKLNDCFVKEFSVGDESYTLDNLKNSRNLNKSGNYRTETMGVQFADGTTALVAYNKNAKQDPFNNNFIGISTTGKGKNEKISLNTTALSILYDVSGYSKPNDYSEIQDIRGVNVVLDKIVCTADLKDGTCLYFLNAAPTVDCSDKNSASDDYKKYCGTPSGYEVDYWAGAVKGCADIGMKLPNETEAKKVFSEAQDLFTNNFAWTSTEYDKTRANEINAAGDWLYAYGKQSPRLVYCID